MIFISKFFEKIYEKYIKIIKEKKTRKNFAMKEMSKAKIIDKRSEKSVKSERTLLQKINHPFIINMHYSFQDKDNLYLVMDLLTGGDLRYHICKNRKFTENQSKFFIACIILSLEFIHSNKFLFTMFLVLYFFYLHFTFDFLKRASS